MKFFSFFLLISLFVQSANAQNNDKDYSEAFELIGVWLEAQKDFEDFPGISASVVKNQQVLWQGAFGKANREKNVSSKTSTLYSICSISKLFTSVAIMKLYDEGKLRLDDNINDLLPDYDLEQKFSDSGPITVRSLLTHSSGLPREANFPYWTGPDFPFPEREQVLEGLSDQETLYPSSTYFQYSNLGLTLLGEIIEEVSGVSYDEYIHANILDPLRLSATRTELPQDLYGEQLAIGYGSEKRDGNRDKLQFFQANGIAAAAGFSSNVEDLSRFASWQFRLLDTTGVEILKSSTLRNMYNVHWMDPDWGTSWGLGFSVFKGPDGKKWVSHGGSCPGYQSVIQLNLADKIGYVVMINANGTNPGKYARGMHEIIKKVKGEQPSRDSTNTNVDLKEFKGYYSKQPWGSEVYLTPWEGKLAILNLPTNSPGEAMELYKHAENDKFYRIREDGEQGEELSFERDKNGNIYRFKSHGNYTVKINP